MGFTDVVEKLGFCYESEEAYDLIDEIMEHVSYAAIDESADLAAERGAYANFEGSRWSQGMVPLDSIALTEADRGMPIKVEPHDPARLGRPAGQGQGRHAQRDADGDRADGIHRSRRRHHARLRPAVLADLQPVHLVGQVPRGQPQPGARPAGARPLGARARVDPAQPGRHPEHRRDPGRRSRPIYKTSFQLSPYAFLEVAARAQKWIDQAISRNMYLETRDLGDMMDIYYAAWERGVKTTYYLHMKPRHQAEQSTVKVNKAERSATPQGWQRRLRCVRPSSAGAGRRPLRPRASASAVSPEGGRVMDNDSATATMGGTVRSTCVPRRSRWTTCSATAASIDQLPDSQLDRLERLRSAVSRRARAHRSGLRRTKEDE